MFENLYCCRAYTCYVIYQMFYLNTGGAENVTQTLSNFTYGNNYSSTFGVDNETYGDSIQFSRTLRENSASHVITEGMTIINDTNVIHTDSQLLNRDTTLGVEGTSQTLNETFFTKEILPDDMPSLIRGETVNILKNFLSNSNKTNERLNYHSYTTTKFDITTKIYPSRMESSPFRNHTEKYNNSINLNNYSLNSDETTESTSPSILLSLNDSHVLYTKNVEETTTRTIFDYDENYDFDDNNFSPGAFSNIICTTTEDVWDFKLCNSSTALSNQVDVDCQLLAENYTFLTFNQQNDFPKLQNFLCKIEIHALKANKMALSCQHLGYTTTLNTIQYTIMGKSSDVCIIIRNISQPLNAEDDPLRDDDFPVVDKNILKDSKFLNTLTDFTMNKTHLNDKLKKLNETVFNLTQNHLHGEMKSKNKKGSFFIDPNYTINANITYEQNEITLYEEENFNIIGNHDQTYIKEQINSFKGYRPSAIHGLIWEDRKYLMTVLIPVLLGIVGALFIVCVAFIIKLLFFEKDEKSKSLIIHGKCPKSGIDNLMLIIESSDEG